MEWYESVPKGACKWIESEAFPEFKHTNPIDFGELIVNLGLDYEKGVLVY